jgi:sporulation protein YlmC with PRC-barrel domain
MRSRDILGGVLAVALLSTTAFAQTAPATQKGQTQTYHPIKKHTGDYRTSKLIGVNVYNRQNEKIGDINEVLVKSGRVSGVVVGVGGFLGVGEHDVLVRLDQIKFVNEPVSAAVATTPAKPVPANTTGTGSAANPPATTADNRAAAGVSNTANRPARAASEKWYPDHAVMSATKDQLKAMPAFKYSNYN